MNAKYTYCECGKKISWWLALCKACRFDWTDR